MIWFWLKFWLSLPSCGFHVMWSCNSTHSCTYQPQVPRTSSPEHSNRYTMNRRMAGPLNRPAGLRVFEKRNISCNYRYSNLGSCRLITILTELSQLLVLGQTAQSFTAVRGSAVTYDTHTHTHTHTYTHTYICVCVCVCVYIIAKISVKIYENID